MNKWPWWALLVLAAPATASATFVFGVPQHQRQWAAMPQDVAVADFNGDGREDLAVLAEGRVDVLFQESGGTLGEPVRLGVDGKGLTAVRAVDLEADGSWQLLAGHAEGLVVYAWGGTGFQRKQHASSGCRKIEAADLDADGRPDVLCLATDAEVSLYYTGSVTSGFGAPVHLPTAAMGSGQPRLSDVTGDGRPDLLLAGRSSNSFFVYVNDGEGGFEPGIAHTYPEALYLWPSAIEALDIDEDGRNEVVVGAPCNRPCSRLYFYRQGVHGQLEPSHDVPTLDSADVLLASDVDGDGHGDLLVGHVGWSTVGRYMGRGAGQGLAAMELWSQVPVQIDGGGIALGDLDNDGAKDLAVANSFGVSVLRGGRAATRDFGNDFASDLLWRNAADDTMVWYSADSARAITPSQPWPGWTVAATGDFDGDALADILWRDPATGAVWHHAMLEGAVAVGLAWQVGGAGDFDGDGRTDLFWRNVRTGANRIWNSADPSDGAVATRIGDLDWEVAGVGDFDGDGRADLLWRHATTGRNSLWPSASHGVSRALTRVSNLDWSVAGVGDFDGDGRDDIAWRNLSTGANLAWKSGSSAMPMAIAGVASQRWKIAALGDYDGDGRADLLWRHANGTNVVWRAANSQATLKVEPLSGWEVVP